MNGAIELPGEANPLNSQNLYRVLAGAASNDRQQIKSGTQQLANWARQPGYHGLLQSIFIDKSLPFEVRYLSIIQLKNGIDNHWRKYAKYIIEKNEKSAIRSRCLDAVIDEPDHRLALHSALVVAKIVRCDYPSEWPEALPLILDSLRQASHAPRTHFHLDRISTILRYVVKEYSSVKIPRSKANLGQIAPEILRVLGGIYVSKVNTWQAMLQNGPNEELGAVQCMKESLLALRVLRRLLVSFFDYPTEEAEIPEFWKIVGGHFDNLLPLVLDASSPFSTPVQNLIGAHLVQIAKYHLSTAQTHPTGFALLPNATSLARSYWALIKGFGPSFGIQNFDTVDLKDCPEADTAEDEKSVMEKVVLKGLLLLRACEKMVYNPAKTFAYQTSDMKERKDYARSLIQKELFTDGFIREVMETLVPQYFVFRLKDIRDWEADAEEWELSEEGESELWELSVRSCAEKLFLDLVIWNRELLVPPLLGVFQIAANVQNTNIALKNSVYTAIGLAAPVLENKMDFGTFLSSTLAPEVQSQRSGYHIIRRRIAILLGQWVPVKEGLDRSLIYQIFQHLLDPNGNDIVVRITAGRQFKHVVEPFEFDAEQFKSFANTIIMRLLKLIQEIGTTDTKLTLLSTLTAIVLRMEMHISDFADIIMQSLPPLWDAAGEEYLFKQSILATTAALMASVGESSSRYHSMIIPLLHSSVQPDSPTQVYLLEDAIDLWAKLLEQAPSSSPELTSLAVYLFPLYSLASDTLRIALEITESYITLIPHEILSSAPDLLTALQPLLNRLKSRDSYRVTNLIELLMRVALLTSGLSALETLTSALLTSQVLPTILSSLQAAHEANQTTGPHATPSPLDPLVETDYLSIIARLAAASPQLFISALTATAPSLGERFETTVTWLLSEWFGHLDNIGHPNRKKLSVLALTTLFAMGEPWMLRRLQELMSVWTETIVELVDEETGKDTLVAGEETEYVKTVGETAKETRMRRVDREDVVLRHDVKVFVGEAVRVVVQRVGTERFQEAVRDVDRDVVVRFEALGVV